jgi:very-short-patch-repair endonuclease
MFRHLRAGRMLGFKFRRQHVIGEHIVDFACVELMMIIELDGAGHADRKVEDLERDELLRDRGWTVLRFGNHEVECELHAVLETIVHEIERVSPLPDPLPRGERETVEPAHPRE